MDAHLEPVGRRRWGRARWLTLVAALVAALVVVLVVVFVLVWFQPQKLFIDDRVDQAVPTAERAATPAPPGPEPSGATTPSAPSEPAEPVDLATGSFVSLDHGASGSVRVFELADGRRYVRFEGFETENGPDLFVYLSTNTADGPESAFDDDYVDLGRLQGNIGDQNYELPPGTDLSRFASVVVWCDRFDSAFGAADFVSAG